MSENTVSLQTLTRGMINCLEYALEFWSSNKDYCILYNSDHVINVPEGIEVDGFLDISYFGSEHLIKSFSLNEIYIKIMDDYLSEYHE